MCYAGEAVEGGSFEGAVDEEGVVVYVSFVRFYVLRNVGGVIYGIRTQRR